MFSGSWELFTLKCLTFCSLFKKKFSSADMKLCALFQRVHSTAATCWCIRRRPAVNKLLSCSIWQSSSIRLKYQWMPVCMFLFTAMGRDNDFPPLTVTYQTIISKRRRTSHCKVIPILETPLNLTKAWNTSDYWKIITPKLFHLILQIANILKIPNFNAPVEANCKHTLPQLFPRFSTRLEVKMDQNK